MRLATWNVRVGGGPRRPDIARAAAALDADVLVFSEYRRSKDQTDLRQLTGELGYSGWVDSGPEGWHLGVAIASREPLVDLGVVDEIPPWSGLVAARVDGLTVVGVYSPGGASTANGQKIKQPWWDALINKTETWRDEPCAVLGDFNTGVRGLDETGRTFVSSESFRELTDHGFRDAWREQHGQTAQEWSWWSNRGGGYRLDHCFVTDTLAVKAASYEHRSGEHVLVRAPGDPDQPKALSDHAALLVELEDTSIRSQLIM